MGLLMGRDWINRWLIPVGLSVVGVGLLWWSSDQLEVARLVSGSTFSFPMWRILGWLVTLVAAGAVFGFAARTASGKESGLSVQTSVLVGALPLFLVVYFWTFFVVGWLPTIGWLTESTVTACCLTVGVLAGGLLSDAIRRFPAGSSR